eukprot:3337726-Alexandrium_andersonii.AAC.1
MLDQRGAVAAHGGSIADIRSPHLGPNVVHCWPRVAWRPRSCHRSGPLSHYTFRGCLLYTSDAADDM